jgi:hypothetical protein
MKKRNPKPQEMTKPDHKGELRSGLKTATVKCMFSDLQQQHGIDNLL